MVKKFSDTWYKIMVSAKDLNGKALFLTKTEYNNSRKRYESAIKRHYQDALKRVRAKNKGGKK